MNRSILIVICDFIITSMIYLNGGFSAIESPFQDGGGATIDRSTVNMIIAQLESQREELEQAREALLKNAGNAEMEKRRQEVQRLSSELANTRSKLEFMQRRARLNRENAGPLTAADLQKELEEEIRKKNLAMAQVEQGKAELAAFKENLRRNDLSLSNLQRQHESVLKELAARSVSLESTQNKLTRAAGEVAKLSERLTSREAELNRQAVDLKNTRQALSGVQSSVQDYRRQLGSAETDLAFLRGRTSAMEKELASTRDRLAVSEKNIRSRDIELASAHTQIENMQTMLKNAVSDLTAVRTELAGENARRVDVQNQLAKLQGDYKAVSSRLRSAENKLRNDVLTRYSQAALKLKVQLREKRWLRDRSENSEFYLPLVRIDERNYLLSALRVFAGTRKNSSQLTDVIDLKYLVSAPNSTAKSPVQRLVGPIRVLDKSDCRVALLEVPDSQAKPLTILTKNDLKQRGIQDLRLFKANSFGKDSAFLDSRCSMSFESDDDYLYIRNGSRVSSELLKAEVGDLVLTKQGELAAVVVALEDYDFNKQQEARCFVFNSLPQVAELPQIDLTKPAGQLEYRDFCDKLNFWLEQARPLDEKKRRR